MIATTNFFTKVLKNQLAKLRLSQNRPYRKNGTSNYSILQFVEGRKSEKPHHPETAQTYFKAIYSEAIDNINSIQKRFEQPGFKVFGQVEQLFLKSINKEDHSDEIMTVESIFLGDYIMIH